tara:strand:- start:144 stop:1205 length:1062 start_codon:yes stop_codon:yes gene_type:complete
MKRITLLFAMLMVIGCIEGDYALYSLHEPEIVEIEIPVEVIVEVPVEVIVEVPVEVPGEGGEVWIDSFEQPYTMDGIDIVWAIDLSGSMHQHAQSVIDGIEAMMNALPPSGWRLGITSGSWYFSSQVQEFPLVPGDTVQDAWDAYNSLTGPTEAGFDSIYSYVIDNNYNHTWLRQDAGLLVVFVSDEDEQSNQQFTSTTSGLYDFINWYGHIRSSVFLASIVHVPATESVCPWPPSGLSVGDRYINATNHFGGVVVDICSPDWAPGVTEAANQSQPHEHWELTYVPLPDTLIVFVDFVEFVDWTYDTTSNRVNFDVLPPEGSLVEIGYVIDSFLPNAGDDDDSSGDDDDSSGT